MVPSHITTLSLYDNAGQISCWRALGVFRGGPVFSRVHFGSPSRRPCWDPHRLLTVQWGSHAEAGGKTYVSQRTANFISASIWLIFMKMKKLETTRNIVISSVAINWKCGHNGQTFLLDSSEVLLCAHYLLIVSKSLPIRLLICWQLNQWYTHVRFSLLTPFMIGIRQNV